MNIEITDIYTALRDSVRFYPAQELPCLRPQTWRVIQQSPSAEIATQNLGATVCDKGKPYFWSRLWHEKQYSPNGIVWAFPLLYCFERDGAIIDPLSDRPKFVYNLEIGVLDVLKDEPDARKCVGCNSRIINEVYQDTHVILQSCLEYLKNTSLYSIDGGPDAWANSDFIDQGVVAQRFTAVRKAGSILIDSQKLSREAQFFRPPGMGNIYGTIMNLSVVASGCKTTTWNFNEPDFGVLAQEAGCLNCG